MSSIRGKFNCISQHKKKKEVIVVTISHNYHNKRDKKIAHKRSQLNQLKVSYHN